MNDAIAFKTRMTGLTTVPINSNKLEQLDEALTEKMRVAPKDFFKAAPFIADLQQASSLTLTELNTIKQTFAKHGLLLVGLTNHSLSSDLLTQAGLANIANQQASYWPTEKLTTQSQTQSKISTQEKLASRVPDIKTDSTAKVSSSPPSVLDNLSAKTKVVKRHIRSGQRLYAPEGDLVIIGIVGAGAEVIADGNIFILGSLRGRAFAGAKGNSAAFIYTQDLNAELISIAGNYQTMEQLEEHKNTNNILITLSEDETMQIKPL